MTQLGNIAQREVAAPLNPEVIIFTRDEQLKKELAAKRFQSLNETMAVLLQAIKSYEHLRRKIADTEEYKQGVDPAKVDQKDILGVIHQYLDQIHWYNIQSGSLQQEAYWDSLEKKSKQDAEIIGLRASWASHAKLAHFAAKDIKQMWDILQGIEITIKKLKQQMPTYQLEPGLGGRFSQYITQLESQLSVEKDLVLSAMAARLKVSFQKRDLQYEDILINICQIFADKKILKQQMILKLKEYKPRRKLTPKLFHEFIAILSQNYKADIKTILDIETKQLGIKLWQSPNYGLVWLPDNFQPNAKANYNDALYGYFSNHYRFIELGLALSDLFDLLSQVVSPKSDNNNQEHDELILLMPLSRNIVKTFNLLEKAVSSATEKKSKIGALSKLVGSQTDECLSLWLKKVDKIYEDLSGRILQAFTVLLQKFQQLPMLVSSGQIATESFDQLLDLKRKIKAIFTCIDVVSNYWGTSENFSSICNDLKKIEQQFSTSAISYLLTALEAQEYYQDKNYINDNTAKVKQLFEDVLVLIENDQVETVINTIMRLILGLEYPPAASVSECITQLCAQTRHDADRFKSCLVNYYLLPQVYVTDSPAYLFLRDFDDFAIKKWQNKRYFVANIAFQFISAILSEKTAYALDGTKTIMIDQDNQMLVTLESVFKAVKIIFSFENGFKDLLLQKIEQYLANYNGEDEYYSRIFDLVADSKLSTSYYQKRFDYLCQNKNWEILAQPLWLRRFTLYPTLVHAVSHNDNTQPSANSLLGYIRPLIFSQFPGDQRSIFNQHFYLLLDKYGSEADKAQYGLLTDKRTFEIIDKMIKSQHDIVKNFKNESQEMRDGLDQATRSAKLIIDKVLQQSWPFPMTQRGYEELNKVISRLLKSSWFPISHLIVQVWANKAQQYDYNRIWLQKLLDGKIIGHHFDDYPHAKYLSELFPYDDQKAVDEIVEMIETFFEMNINMLRNNQGQFNAEAMEVISNYLTNSRELFSDEKHAQFVRSRDELIQLKVQQAQSMGVAAEILSNVKSGDYAFACNKFIQVWNFILSSQNETNVSMRVYDFYQFILGWIQAAPKTEQEKQRFQHFIQTLRSEKKLDVSLLSPTTRQAFNQMLFDVIGRPNSQYACELFLVIGISLAEKDQQRGFTLLHTALYKGADFTTLTYLAGHVASLLLKRSKDGSFTVHSASVSAEPETFKWLLDNRITPLNVFNGQQWTPLHLAVTPITSEYDDEDDKMRYVQRLKLLLQYGAKINLPGSGNQTALDRVLSEGDKALLMLMFLLQKGVDANNVTVDRPNAKKVGLLLQRYQKQPFNFGFKTSANPENSVGTITAQLNSATPVVADELKPLAEFYGSMDSETIKEFVRLFLKLCYQELLELDCEFVNTPVYGADYIIFKNKELKAVSQYLTPEFADKYMAHDLLEMKNNVNELLCQRADGKSFSEGLIAQLKTVQSLANNNSSDNNNSQLERIKEPAKVLSRLIEKLNSQFLWQENNNNSAETGLVRSLQASARTFTQLFDVLNKIAKKKQQFVQNIEMKRHLNDTGTALLNGFIAGFMQSEIPAYSFPLLLQELMTDSKIKMAVKNLKPLFTQFLWEAAIAGKVELFQLMTVLIDDLNFRDENGNTLLHSAAISPNPQLMAWLLSFYEQRQVKVPINTLNDWCLAPIHLAASHGCSDVLDLLLSKGAEINLAGYGQQTPLHRAYAFDKQKNVEFLLSKNANPECLDTQGFTPKKWAMELGLVQETQATNPEEPEVNQEAVLN